jgi:hypothetical protein
MVTSYMPLQPAAEAPLFDGNRRGELTGARDDGIFLTSLPLLGGIFGEHLFPMTMAWLFR